MDEKAVAPIDAPPPAAAPPFHRRLVEVFVAPGRLFAALRADPRWAIALLVGAGLVALSSWLIPVEVWSAFARDQIQAQGREIPEGFDFGAMQRVFGVVGGVFGWALFTFLTAGIVTFVFAFVLGDDGRFRQYLAVVAHAFLIAAVGALLVTPLKIAQEDPTLTLNLGLFAVGLDPDLYPVRVLGMLDLFQLWGWFVMGVGVHAIDPRRGVGTAVAVLMAFAVALAMVFALFVPA